MEEKNKDLQANEVEKVAKEKDSVNKEPVKKEEKKTTNKKAESKEKTTEKNTKTENTAKSDAKTVEKKSKVENTAKSNVKTTEKKTVTTENKTKPAEKKVQTKNNEDKTKFEPAKNVKKKKKHTLLKFILILIIIVIIAFMVNFFRNYIIMSKIFNERAAYKDVTNYSYCQTNNDTSGVNNAQWYIKDNTIILMLKDRQMMVWSNKDTQETIILNYNDMKATIRKDNYFVKASLVENENGIASIGDEQTVKGFSFMYFIASENVNGVDCYKVKFDEETSWYSKENGMLIKYKNGSLDIDYSDWQFNKLTDSDVARPNLLGFTVENEEN